MNYEDRNYKIESIIYNYRNGEFDKNDFSQLIDTAKEQSQMLAAMLQQNKSNNVVAPSTTNNYTYVVESGVSKFRNSVNPIA